MFEQRGVLGVDTDRVKTHTHTNVAPKALHISSLRQPSLARLANGLLQQREAAHTISSKNITLRRNTTEQRIFTFALCSNPELITPHAAGVLYTSNNHYTV